MRWCIKASPLTTTIYIFIRSQMSHVPSFLNLPPLWTFTCVTTNPTQDTDYLLLFFEGVSYVPSDTEQYLNQGLYFYPRRVMVFMEGRSLSVSSCLVLYSHSPYSSPLQFCKLFLWVSSSCFSLRQQFFVLDCPVPRTAGANRHQTRAIFHPRHASC